MRSVTTRPPTPSPRWLASRRVASLRAASNLRLGPANAASLPRVFEPPDLDPPQCVGRFALSAGQKAKSLSCVLFFPFYLNARRSCLSVDGFSCGLSPGAGVIIHRGADGPFTFHALVKYRHVLGISGGRTFKQQQHFQLGEKWAASNDVFRQ